MYVCEFVFSVVLALRPHNVGYVAGVVHLSHYAELRPSSFVYLSFVLVNNGAGVYVAEAVPYVSRAYSRKVNTSED